MNDNFAYRSYIKDIYLELPEYKFHHSPLDGESEDSKNDDELFIGREKIKSKFLNILLEGKNNGAYLVTGYRGMGKTSFVQKVVQEYRNEVKKNRKNDITTIHPINISFAQSDLKEVDILRQMTKSMIDEAEKNWVIKTTKIFSLVSIFRFITFSLSSLFLYKFFFASNNFQFQKHLENILTNDNGNNLLFDILSILLVLIIASLAITYSFFFLKSSTFIFSSILINTIKNIGKIKDNFVLKNKKIFNSKTGFIFDSTIRILPTPFIILFVYQILHSDKFKNTLKLIIEPLSYKILINSNHSLKQSIIESIVQIFIFTVIFIIFFIFNFKLLQYLHEYIIEERKIYEKLKDLYERCNATVTKEASLQSAATVNIPFGFIQRNVKVYPVANSKEIEYELLSALKRYNSFKYYKKKFIIIFDELDKVEPTIGKGYYYDDTKTLEQYEFAQNQLNDIRQRKRIIINILASLKYFITEANARFIFIAGREMFDAALADIADRQSSISSIFHHIIYVDSFLKDKVENSNGVTDLVELYLQKILLPKDINKKLENESFLTFYFQHLEEIDKKSQNISDISIAANMKIIFNLQNFIIYLTYRSNGSPKKMVKLLEEYIYDEKEISKNKPKIEKSEINNLQVIKIVSSSTLKSSDRRLFLKFNINDQYKFGLITYLYRPFILTYSQFLKRYSDNVLVSTPYLMDHLIKFHPFAFSMQNLELLPEVISVNRNPILRNFIEELVVFLNQNHIRETEIGLFEYKFFSKSANEIVFLSKIFEEESAAFNFTLDENYFIKVHLRKKIKDIRSSYREFKEGNTFIHSISFLNTILGDAFFFDQEFDEAIISYSDALQHLRDIHPMSYETFVLYMRLSLKLGLVYEKMKSYEVALSYYNDAIDKANKYMDTYGNKYPENQKNIYGIYFYQEDKPKYPTPDKKDRVISFNELLQIVNQAYIASLYIQEKLSIEGVTIRKISNYYENFVGRINTVGEKDDINYLLLSNFDSNVGTMLYYKNLVHFNPNLNNTQNIKYNVKELLLGIFTKKGSEIILKDSSSFPCDNKDYRFSIPAFKSYKSALLYLLQNKVKQEDKPLNEIIKGFASQLNEYNNLYSKTYLKNVANNISKIADCLLSTYNKPEMTTNGQGSLSSGLICIAKNWYYQYKLANNLSIYIEELEKVSKQENSSLEIHNLTLSNSWGWGISKEKKVVLEEIDNYKKSAHKWSFLEKKSKLTSIIDELKKMKQGYRIMPFLDQEVFGYLQKTIVSNEFEYILALYYLSGRYYSKAGKNVSFSFQLRKILQVIKHNIKIEKIQKNDIQDKFIKFIEEGILGLILELTSRNSYSSDRPQIYKYKHNFGNDNIYHPKRSTKYIYTSISNNPEIREAVLLFADIKIQSLDFKCYESLNDIINKIPEMSLIHPYAGVSSQFTRFQELDIQEKINRIILETYLNEKFGNEKFCKKWEDEYFRIYKKINPDNPQDKSSKLTQNEAKILTDFISRLAQKDIKHIEEYEQIVASSIFSLIQITNILRIYDVNYYLCYSYLGNFHRKLGDWLKHFKLCQELRKQVKNNEFKSVDKYLQDMLGNETMFKLDTTSQYQIALQHYHRAKQVHSNGNAYENLIRNFIYLEDDFNDNLYHFGVALERQYINSYHLRNRIKEMELELKDSPLYSYDSFANTDTFY